ncbi:hypothetical protein [Actinomyces oricola]
MTNNTSQRDLDLAILATGGHTIWWDETGQPAPRPDDFFDPDSERRPNQLVTHEPNKHPI